jgi:hypothetical protein
MVVYPLELEPPPGGTLVTVEGVVYVRMTKGEAMKQGEAMKKSAANRGDAWVVAQARMEKEQQQEKMQQLEATETKAGDAGEAGEAGGAATSATTTATTATTTATTTTTTIATAATMPGADAAADLDLCLSIGGGAAVPISRVEWVDEEARVEWVDEEARVDFSRPAHHSDANADDDADAMIKTHNLMVIVPRRFRAQATTLPSAKPQVVTRKVAPMVVSAVVRNGMVKAKAKAAKEARAKEAKEKAAAKAKKSAANAKKRKGKAGKAGR